MRKIVSIFSGAYLTVISSASFAAEAYLHGETAHHLEEAIEAAEHAPKGGLPQFDPEWFASQVFWLAISFAILYMIFAKKTLPDISSVIENRKNHIQSDLETAEKLTAEADAVHDAYQENLNKAQIGAAEAIKEVENKGKAAADEAVNNFRQQSDVALLDAEKRIDASKVTAMDDMNQIAANAAAQAVEKIIGVKADSSKIETIIKNMNGKPPPKKSKNKSKAA